MLFSNGAIFVELTRLEETMLGSTVPLLKLTKFFQNANKAPYRKVNMPVGKNEQHPFFIL
ncbi:hypothetical protein [Candidatus Phytoplasma australiense]|uniref:Uncharacterized protein n=1 Tax=Strawberry lethal yellows phytoplasma (CPA) str. NZSb11 TaxID=980422 RepID=R4RLA9_PHYAS|nr:hypothetical protein [Candidatus Phytoplasma australiense]AGL90125.1 Hypothetical Protein SLY_0202 [Strawberry lethal yellows phytoplasma (CPA) str. NZSb11]